MTVSAPKAVVFDIGGVLLDWDPRYLYRKLLPDEESVETFLGTICTDAWNLEQDRGRCWEEACALLAEQHPEKTPLIHAYHERWEEMVQDAIWDTVVIMDDLRAAGAALYSITNFSRDKFDLAVARYPFLGTFDGIIVSGDVRLVKPDNAIYELFYDTYGLDPADLVFIDDKPANVEASKQTGMAAIHFTSANDLRSQLKKRSLL